MSFIKKYNCSQCNYGSDRKWTVKDHERRVHNNVNVTNQSNEFPTTFSVTPIVTPRAVIFFYKRHFFLSE